MRSPTSIFRNRTTLRTGRLQWTPLFTIGVAMFVVLIAIAVLAPMFLEDAATELGRAVPNLGFEHDHLLGTDGLGRDVLARTLVATRTTVIMGAAATVMSAIVGVAIGIGTWLAPPRIRELALRAIEFLVSYPTLLVAIIIAAILGRGTLQVVVAIAIANIGGFARLTANLAAGISSREYVTTARLMGVPTTRLAFRHVLPNMSEPILILVAQQFGFALMDISGLSFVGLGAQTPQFDWGTMLNDSLKFISTSPIRVVGPAVALVFATIASLFIGDGLAASANPRSKSSRARLRRAVEPPDHSDSSAPDDAILVAEGITVHHADTGKLLVSDVSFHIGRGEVLGIVGESGSGKSVTSTVVARLLAEGLDASARRITLGDLDLLDRVPDRTLAARVALVYQDPGTALNPALTLGSQFTDVLVRRLGTPRKAARRAILEKFSDVLLADPEGRMRQYPHQLSGGMKQRSMIASAMSTHPDLLIADEPTTALDVTVQREVLSLIKRMNRDLGTSVLFISHDLGVVRALCDRVIVMKDGAIVERIDHVSDLSEDRVKHPYTKKLLAATPTVTVPEGRRSAPVAAPAAEVNS